MAGPIGVAVGAVVGGVAGGLAGGLAGKEVAERIDPTRESAYWRENYQSRDYYDDAVTYDSIEPAYHMARSRGRAIPISLFDEAEPLLQADWEKNKSREVAWDRARLATRDAWDRVEER